MKCRRIPHTAKDCANLNGSNSNLSRNKSKLNGNLNDNMNGNLNESLNGGNGNSSPVNTRTFQGKCSNCCTKRLKDVDC